VRRSYEKLYEKSGFDFAGVQKATSLFLVHDIRPHFESDPWPIILLSVLFCQDLYHREH